MTKPVFKMTKEECITEMTIATERTARTQAICKHFYAVTGELISAYCQQGGDNMDIEELTEELDDVLDILVDKEAELCVLQFEVDCLRENKKELANKIRRLNYDAEQTS